tara:strand:- start:1326 stop:1589 length:264 start_codon:yes stop_codon:yes gene_type:complete
VAKWIGGILEALDLNHANAQAIEAAARPPERRHATLLDRWGSAHWPHYFGVKQRHWRIAWTGGVTTEPGLSRRIMCACMLDRQAASG